jgi:exopolyphosphatase/pppGpp-phosphohydrolase
MDAVLNRKQRATPPVPRIFDGEKEARLIALACYNLPKAVRNGRCACWKAKSSN